MKKIIIAIDGFSSCGKSTFAKAIAAELGYVFVDTGAMYRAVALHALDCGYVSGGKVDEGAVVSALNDIRLDFKVDPATGRSEIMLNGVNEERRIRSIEVSGIVSAISSIPQVRERLVALQQAMGRNRALVMDGRDIGTVVFPDAELKIFMTADPEVRARRRYDELTAKGERVSMDEIRQNIAARDRQDQNRAVSPLRMAPDAILLDNSHMTPDQQMEWVREKIARLV